MNRFVPRAVILASSVFVLSGCSFVAGLFPDKQKQYKYSSEIPALEIPPDLQASTIEGGDERPATGENRDRSDRYSPAAETQTKADDQPSGSQATLAQNSEDIPLIELEAPYAEAWNDVGKALGRLRLEVSDQNRSDGIYYVYFSGDDKPYEDRGFLGDIGSFFTGSETPAKEYRIKLEDRRDVVVIYVLDQEGKPQSEGPGFELLKRLHQTLQSLGEPQEPEKE
ncbi:outer membrane protein assembly factor BamC [Methylocaldum sp. GT1BB]|uniref:outer membrane protein assembly factor BamC n=1 Tax=Methylocaldum sp. GT1BB TaxID=3438963 RepID=UPI003DA16656